tara:strand:- start:1269 stop:1670 length:402 start_codon:yes stop_codon:yes gene_type:complete
MNLLQSLLPIAAVAAGSYFGGGAGAATGERLATSFLTSQGRTKGSAPFGAAPTVKPRTAAELAAGSRTATAQVQMNPIQQVMQSDPRIESAMVNLVNNATNQNIIDLFSKHGGVRYTAKGGRAQTIQQTNIQV